MDSNQKPNQQSEITRAEKETQKNADDTAKKPMIPPSKENSISNEKPMIPPDNKQDEDNGTDVADNRTEEKNSSKEENAANVKAKNETHTYLN